MDDGTIPSFPFEPGPLAEPPWQFAWLRERRPVARVALPSGDTAWLVTGYDEVLAVLSDPRLSRAAMRAPGAPRLVTGVDFSDNPHNVLNREGADHARVRRALAPFFTQGEAERWRPRVQQLAEELLDELEAVPRPADLYHGFVEVLPIRVICEIVGAPPVDWPKLRAWSKCVGTVTNRGTAERVVAGRALVAYARDLVTRRGTRSGSGLLRRLVASRNQVDGLTEKELVEAIGFLLMTGHDPLVSAISRGVFTLLRHREQWELLCREPGLIGSVVEEVLRYAPPSEVGFMRVATDPTRVGEVTVADGEGVLPIVYAAGRDRRHFPDPDRFDVTRQQNRHLAFGHGPHRCLGAAVARMELQVAFGTLARRLTGLRLAVQPEEVRWFGGSMTVRPGRLPVTW